MGGGGSKTETRYEYKDNTAERKAEEQRREAIRLENERNQREIAERQRIAREASAAAERERQQFLQKLEQQKRAEEAERIRKEQEAEKKRLHELELKAKALAKRKELFDYEFGSKIDTASFRGLDIGDVNKLRIGVFGPTGSGKSCFISTCERVVRNVDKGSSPIATSGQEGTIVLEDFLPEMFFHLVDTRGFFNYDANEGGEFSDILYGRMKPGDFIRRKKEEPNFDYSSTDAPFSDWVHGIILVVKANDPRLLEEGRLRDYLLPVRQILRPIGISPVTVVTHKDTLKPEQYESALSLASAATGSSLSHTFFVTNYCDQNPDNNVYTELQIFDILHFAILTAERYVKIAKQQKRNREEDNLLLHMESPSASSCTSNEASIEMFLNLLQRKYKWKEAEIKKVLANLEEEDIKTMGVLAANWEDVKSVFSIGMRNSVDKQLRNMNMI